MFFMEDHLKKVMHAITYNFICKHIVLGMNQTSTCIHVESVHGLIGFL